VEEFLQINDLTYLSRLSRRLAVNLNSRGDTFIFPGPKTKKAGKKTRKSQTMQVSSTASRHERILARLKKGSSSNPKTRGGPGAGRRSVG